MQTCAHVYYNYNDATATLNTNVKKSLKDHQTVHRHCMALEWHARTHTKVSLFLKFHMVSDCRVNQIKTDGEPSIGMPPPENLSITLTFEPMTLNT